MRTPRRCRAGWRRRRSDRRDARSTRSALLQASPGAQQPSAAVRLPPRSNPMTTGRADCDSTSAAMLRLVAPSAIRTPISLVRCSTRYESTLNSPDNVSRSASAPSTSVSQNGICQQIHFHARDGLQRGDLAHVGIDRRQPIDERMARALGIAAHTHRQRRPGRLGADRHVDTCSAQPHAAEPKARDVPGDANDDNGAREQRRIIGSACRSSGPTRAAGPARPHRCPATAGARRFRTRPPPRRLRCARSA